MNYFVSVLIFIFGLCVGSFLNVVICRLETGEGIIKSRSKCPKCKTVLKPIDLIPLFSFIFQKGLCRYCKQKVSWQYPLVELSTALLFLFLFRETIHNQQSTISNYVNLLFYFFIASVLIIIFVYDFKTSFIPDKVIYPATIIAFLYRLLPIKDSFLTNVWQFSIFNFQFSVFSFILAAIGVGGFFLILVLISHEKWIGWGDVKLSALMGLILGLPIVFISLYIAFILGGLVAIILVILKKKGLKSEIPFGPFLVTGTFIAIFFNQQILSWVDKMRLFV
jgi:leader peptidase (prepilin peptidase)/N-methyltransferase